MTSDKSLRPPALRYAINDPEYELLHHFLSRGREDWETRSVTAEGDGKPGPNHEEYHASTIRSSLRVFIGTAAGLKAWDFISTSLLSHDTMHK